MGPPCSEAVEVGVTAGRRRGGPMPSWPACGLSGNNQPGGHCWGGGAGREEKERKGKMLAAYLDPMGLSLV